MEWDIKPRIQEWTASSRQYLFEDQASPKMSFGFSQVVTPSRRWEGDPTANCLRRP
jgi:hypothetical protein